MRWNEKEHLSDFGYLAAASLLSFSLMYVQGLCYLNDYKTTNESFLWHDIWLKCINDSWLCGSSAALLWTGLCQNTQQMGHGNFYLYTAWTLCLSESRNRKYGSVLLQGMMGILILIHYLKAHGRCRLICIWWH